RVERDLPGLVETVDVRVGQDLPDRLLDSRLREIAREDAIPVGADHARLEAHREGELRDDDRQQGEHEDHREQRESLLLADVPLRAHGVLALIDTLTGGCSTGWPPTMVVSVTSTARGTARSWAPSHVSSHDPSASRR